MTLYSGMSDPLSHRTRIVLYEKDIECQVVELTRLLRRIDLDNLAFDVF